MLLPALLLASAAVLTTQSNDFKLKANGYFEELTSAIVRDLIQHANDKMYLIHNYSVEIGGSPFTLSLNNGTIEELSNITYSGTRDVVYTIPAVGALYTIGKALLHFKFDLASDSEAVDWTGGEVTLEVSGVGVNEAVAAYDAGGGKYAAQVVVDKLAVTGELEHIKPSSRRHPDLKGFVEILFQMHYFSISTAIHREFSNFFHNAVEKVDVSKYLQS